MAVRAKFRVDYKSQPYVINQWLSDDQKSGVRAVQDVIMSPVSYEGSDENKQFFASTPSGQIRLTMTNPRVFVQFTQGKEYYIDFTSADEANKGE